MKVVEHMRLHGVHVVVDLMFVMMILIGKLNGMNTKTQLRDVVKDIQYGPPMNPMENRNM